MMTESEKRRRLLNGNRPQETPTSDNNSVVPIVPRHASEPSFVPRSLGTDASVPNAPSVPRHQRKDLRSTHSRQRRNCAQLNVSIAAELVDALRERAYEDRRTVADIIEQLVYSYVAAPSEPIVPSVPRHTPDSSVPRHLSDDLMIDDVVCTDAVSIIDHQCRELLPKRELTEKDRWAVEKFVRDNGPFDAYAVQIAIATTMMRTAEQSISSVNYFFPELKKAMTMMSETQRREMAPTRVWKLRREKPELYA
jgi:hypothetical protein